MQSPLPDAGFLKLAQIIGQREITQKEADANRSAAAAEIAAGEKPRRRPMRARPGIPGVLPMSKSRWWDGVATGRYPRPAHDGPSALWSVSAIRELLDRIVTLGDAPPVPGRTSAPSRHGGLQAVSP